MMQMKKELTEKALKAKVELADKKQHEKETTHLEALEVMKERLKKQEEYEACTEPMEARKLPSRSVGYSSRRRG